MRIPLRTLSITAAILAAAPGLEARAQGGGIVRQQEAPRAPEARAPALPGLAARRAPAPIASDPAATNLAPNAALFDAIGRGDLPAARDAVGRGANVNARNALGLTPLDAAVDQGRNEIVFYLLSARDASRGPVEEDAPAAAAPPARTARPVPTPRPPRAPLNTQPVLAAQPRSAQLWSGDGGAARPEVGFLGFDAGRPDGATAPAPAPRRPPRG